MRMRIEADRVTEVSQDGLRDEVGAIRDPV